MAQASQTGLGFLLGTSEGIARCKQTCEAVQNIENCCFYSGTLHISHIHHRLGFETCIHKCWKHVRLTSGCFQSCSEKTNLFSSDLPELLICFGMPPPQALCAAAGTRSEQFRYSKGKNNPKQILVAGSALSESIHPNHALTTSTLCLVLHNLMSCINLLFSFHLLNSP